MAALSCSVITGWFITFDYGQPCMCCAPPPPPKKNSPPPLSSGKDYICTWQDAQITAELSLHIDLYQSCRMANQWTMSKQGNQSKSMLMFFPHLSDHQNHQTPPLQSVRYWKCWWKYSDHSSGQWGPDCDPVKPDEG